MSDQTINPIYQLNKMSSRTEIKDIQDMSDILDCIKDINTGHAIVWLFSEIKTAYIRNGELKTDLLEGDLTKYLVKARFFNQDKEWHIWRVANGLKARLREDNNNAINEVEYIDAEMPLKAVITKVLTSTGFTGKNIKLITRNYIDYQNNQAGYCDLRFVDFKN